MVCASVDTTVALRQKTRFYALEGLEAYHWISICAVVISICDSALICLFYIYSCDLNGNVHLIYQGTVLRSAINMDFMACAVLGTFQVF